MTSNGMTILLNLPNLAEDETAKALRRVALDIQAQVFELSPVDTGLYRSNHHLTLDEPAKDIVPIGTPPPIVGLENVKADSVIFASNPVHYAGAIELGSSRQRPEGVYRVARENTIARLDKILGGQ